MTSESHGVASKIIATVDDLEAIASDDKADVPALHGWRRDLFARRRLLKRGRILLGVKKNHVVAPTAEPATPATAGLVTPTWAIPPSVLGHIMRNSCALGVSAAVVISRRSRWRGPISAANGSCTDRRGGSRPDRHSDR